MDGLVAVCSRVRDTHGRRHEGMRALLPGPGFKYASFDVSWQCVPVCSWQYHVPAEFAQYQSRGAGPCGTKSSGWLRLESVSMWMLPLQLGAPAG